MPKVRKFKVDEWVWYTPFQKHESEKIPHFKFKALILSICDLDDFYDYRIYIEDGAKFKKVKEKALLSV